MIQVLAGVAGSLRAGPGVLNPDTSAPSDQTDMLPKSLQPPWPQRPSRQRSAPVLAESPAGSAVLLRTHRTIAAAVPLVSCVRLSMIPQTVARQASLSLTVSPSFPKFDSCYPGEKRNWFPSAGSFSNKQNRASTRGWLDPGEKELGARASASRDPSPPSPPERQQDHT